MTTLSFVEKNITESSLISHVKWEQTSAAEEPLQGSLMITFKSSSMLYAYPNVPFDIVESFLASSSLGQYFSKNIKPIYTCSKQEIQNC